MTKFVQCEQCKMKIPGDKCEFAVYKCVVEGEEHVFCCQRCAERYQKKRKS